MTRSVKLLTPMLTVVVVFACELAHARLVGHYPTFAEPRFAWVCVLVFLILVTTYAAGVSEPFVSHGGRLARAFAAVGSAVILVALIQLLSRKPLVPLFVLFFSFVVLIPLTTILASLGEQSRIERGAQERVVAIVALEEQDRLRRDMSGPLEHPAVLVALTTAKSVLPSDSDPRPLETLLTERRGTLLVLDREAQSMDEIVAQAAGVHAQGIRIRTLSLFYDGWLGKLPISELERIALLFDINEIHRPVYARLKRFFDVVLALVGVVVLAVAVPVVLLADLVGNRGPLLYRQTRVGRGGSTFTILKFRTMTPGDGPTNWTAQDDPRLNRVGRILRRLHVDELPQVVNVLRRDLSIVGPRPEQPLYVDQLTESIPFYDSRHLVRPGITGWAQVKYDYGASELDALEKLQYEFYYLRHQSLALDLRIMGRTIRSIVELKGR